MLWLLWLVFVVPLIFGVRVQRQLEDVFIRYREVPNHVGATGAQVARALLDAYGLGRVRLERSPGPLSDHYDGEADVMRLSDVVAGERTVAAMGIAAHEVGHALQDAEGSRVYRARRTVGEPVARLAPWSGLFFVGGFLLGVPVLAALSIAFAAGLVVFALVTVPVELGASRRALDMLMRSGLANPSEADAVRRVLRAAAMTYLVNVLARVGWLVALVALAEAGRHATT